MQQVVRHCYTRNDLDLAIHRLRTRKRVAIPFYPYKYREERQHKIARHLPGADHRDFLISIRDPLGLYKSHYYFGWWRDFPETYFSKLEALQREWPDFPGLSLDEFCSAVLRFGKWTEKPPASITLGPFSAELVHYTSRDPERVWSDASSDGALLQSFLQNRLRMHWLRQDRLAAELKEFLGRFSLTRSVEACPLLTQRINKSSSKKDAISHAVRDEIQRCEWLLGWAWENSSSLTNFSNASG